MNKSKVISDSELLIVADKMQHEETQVVKVPESIRNFKRISDTEISFTVNTTPSVVKDMVFSHERGAEVITDSGSVVVSKKAIQRLCDFNKDVSLLRDVALGSDYQMGLIGELQAKLSRNDELTI